MSVSIKPLEQVGSGTYGTVFKALDESTNQIVALKIARNSQEYGVVSPIELDIMKRSKHPNIMRFIQINMKIKSIYIVMPFGTPVMNVDLDRYDRVSLVRDLVSAVLFLHDNDLYHCDIKLDNMILIDGRLVLSDFGISLDQASQSLCYQTAPYSPPENIFEIYGGQYKGFDEYIEIYSQKPDSAASDYWALGVSIIDLLIDKSIFAKSDINGIIKEMNTYLSRPLKYIWPLIQESEWVDALLEMMNPQTSQRSVDLLLRLLPPINKGSFTKLERKEIKDEVIKELFDSLSNWLYDICSSNKIDMRIYVGSLDIIIRYMTNTTEVRDPQLIASVAFFIMSKVIKDLTIEDIQAILYDRFKNEEITKMEISMIKVLKGAIYPWDIIKAFKAVAKEYTYDEFIETYWK